MKTKAQHPLFTAYPLQNQKEISIGSVPTPYHVYDGQGLLIGGTADLTTVTQLLKNETVHPIQTTSGKALIGIWVVDFAEASLGPHNELQFSILVSHQPVAPVADHPLALLGALFANPAVRMFCYGLWNNTETAVAYNRELLGLNAQINQGAIQQKNGQTHFHFTDAANNLLFAGQVHRAKRTSPSVGWSLLRLLGFKATLQGLTRPYLGAKVVNPIGKVIAENRDAQSYLAADTPILQQFNPAKDSITFGEPFAAQFNFQPKFIEQFDPFRFVYLMPEPLANR